MAYCKFCGAQISEGIICSNCLSTNRQAAAFNKPMPQFSLNSRKSPEPQPTPPTPPTPPKFFSAQNGARQGAPLNGSAAGGAQGMPPKPSMPFSLSELSKKYNHLKEENTLGKAAQAPMQGASAAPQADSNPQRYAQSAAPQADGNPQRYTQSAAPQADSNPQRYAQSAAPQADSNPQRYAQSAAPQADGNPQRYAQSAAPQADSAPQRYAQRHAPLGSDNSLSSEGSAAPRLSPNQSGLSRLKTPPQGGESDEAENNSEAQKQVFSSDVTGYGDEELETSILAAVMKDTFILDSLKAKGLIAGLFSTKVSRTIYQGILALREESPDMTSLDKIVMKNKLKNANLLNSGTLALLDRIMAEPPVALDRALYFLELMKTQALKRKLKEVSGNITDFIDNPAKYSNDTIETFTNRVIRDVRNIQKAKSTKRINLVKEEMREIMGDIDNREVTGEIDIIGYSCEPMHYLNAAISGFRKGFMYAIAGAPRRGKTTFTLELATRVATLNKIPVLFFTYEQTKKNLTYRLLAKESRLNPDTLQRKKIRSDIIAEAKFMGGWKKMQEYMNYFYIVEATKEDTIDRIRSYAYNAMQDFNTQDLMIFIDYIQKMPLSRNYNDEKFKIEEISTELKALSIELNNPIMTISSLSKEGCQIDAADDASRPTMYHCKGSGDLEYDLDCAMIQAKDWGDTHELYQQLQQRAEELHKDSTRIPKVDVVNLYLDKNRDAPEGIYSTLQYLFFIEDNKFIELGPKFDDDRYRYSKIEELVDKLIKDNFIIFYDKPADAGYGKGRVSIKLKNF